MTGWPNSFANTANCVPNWTGSEVPSGNRGQRIAVLETRIAELVKENEVLRTAKARQGSEEGQGTKQRIDELVNENDRCLALLNN